MSKYPGFKKFAESFFLWLKWLPLMVALMSGAFSLYREVYGLYIGVIPPKSLFWECVLIAFIISSAIAWAQERMKYLAEVEKRHSPNISITVHQVSVGFSRSGDPTILTIISVRNTGEPSIVDTWLMTLDDTKLTTRKMTAIEDLTWGYENGTTYTFSVNDQIHKKVAEQPVPAGGKRVGFMLWRVEGSDFKPLLDTRQIPGFTLTARDVNGTLITAKNKATSIRDDDLGYYYPGLLGPN